VNKLVLFVLLIFIIQGCGQNKSVEAQFVVNLGALTGDALPQGGLIIYGQNSSGTQMFAQPISSSSYSIELENGDWNFYALSWAGPQILDGELKCAQTFSKLNGDPITVSLDLSTTACNSDKFSGEMFRYNGLIQPIKILSCSDLVGLSSNSTCSSNPGLHQSIEIVLNSYRGPSPISKVDESKKLKSFCIPLTSSFPNSLRLPTGSSLLAINTEIHAYASSNCSGALKNIFYFPLGLSQGDSLNAQIFDHAGNPDYVKIFLRSELNVPQPTISYVPSIITGNVGTFISINPILSLNGFPIKSCISTSLPPGLFIDSTSCVISGTPSAAFSQTPITVTVSTITGVGTKVLNMNISAVAPNLSYVGALGTSGQLNSFMLVSPSTLFDGGAPISCIIDPSTPLPSGLAVNISNCDISGYPTVIPSSTNFNVIVTNSVGSMSAQVTLTVAGSSVTIPTTTALSTPTSIINYSPATGISNISQPSFNVSGQFNPGATVRIFSDPTCTQTLGSSPVVGSLPAGVVNILVSLPFDGPFTLYADQIDTSGNKSLCSPALGYYTLDRVPPLMPVIYGVTGSSNSSDNTFDNLLTSGHIAKVSWSPISDASSYLISITDFYTGNSICPPVTISATQFQGNYSFENCGLKLGSTYAVQVKVFDHAGNFSTSTNFQFNLVSPSWTPLSQYGTPMKNHNALWINVTGSGYSGMYVWGGESSTGPVPTSYSYDVSNDQWSALYSGNLPSPRKDHTAIWIGGGILTWGGFNGTSTLADGYFWNMTTSQWSQIPPATTPRSGHAAFWQEISGLKRMVVFGGRGGSSSTSPTYFNSIEVYDPNTNLWSPLSVQGNIPPAREKMAYAYFETEKKFFIWGGSNSGVLSDGWILDFNFNPAKWININSINAPTNRTEISYSSFNDGDPKFVIWGGRSTVYGSDLNTGYIYNLTTNSWSTMTISNAPLARSGAKMIWTGNEIMVWGGKMQGVSTDTGAFYDVKSDTWLETSLQSAPEPRSGHSMVLDPAAKEVYVYGGEDQNGIILSNLYKIKP